MKTSHQFARELLTGPDMPIFHFDPSCAGYNEDDDTSVSEPSVEIADTEKDESGNPLPPFMTINGDQHNLHDLDEGV